MFQTHIQDQLKQLSHDLIEEYVKCRQQSLQQPRVCKSNNGNIKMSVQPIEVLILVWTVMQRHCPHKAIFRFGVLF